MDTLENENEFPREEMTDRTEPVAAEVTAQEPAAPEEPEPAAQMPVQEPAPQEPAPQRAYGEEPYWYAPQPGYVQQPPQGYYPPQPGYYHYQYRQPAPRPGYYQPGAYQQPQAYAEPGTRQNAYVPPRPQAEPAPSAPPAPPKAKKKKGGFWKGLVAAILILALVGGSCVGTAFYVNHQWEERAEAMTESFNSQIGALRDQIDANTGVSNGTSISGSYAPTGEGMTPAQVYANNVRSVVAITCSVTTSYYGQTTTGTSTGSGFILTEDGYIVTNYHVIEGASSVTVTTNEGINYTAAIVGGDSTNDIAVLKVEGSGLPAVTIGSSSALIVGDQVAAIGNPLGELTNTLTVGYVSAKDRMVTTEGFGINMLQTDAAINSGNSGGPLFNMYGQVVGITSAKYSGESSSGASIEGIGFAIPIDDVIGMIEDLVNQGYIGGAYLGVQVSDMNAEAADYYGLPVGAYVQEATAGGAAEKAGVQTKDIIVALGDHEINGVTSLTRALRNFAAGETTTITVYRNGAELVLTITLDAKPQS